MKYLAAFVFLLFSSLSSVMAAPLAPFVEIARNGSASLSQSAFLPSRTPPSAAPFDYLEGQDIGLDRGFMYGIRDYTDPFWFGRGTTSGDYDRDGWQDILLAGNQGFFLYHNTGGKFARVLLPASIADRHEIFAIALVDLNRDNWPDIFYTTFADGNFLVLNRHGEFDFEHILAVPNQKALLTLSPAFADIDGDGFVDVLNGNVALGVVSGFHHMKAGRNNSIVFNGNLQFRDVLMESTSGETMATLISDINNDGITDIYFGNDFFIPDKVLLGDGRGYSEVKGNRLIPFTPFYSMGADTGDINNDLELDLVMMGTMSSARNVGKSLIDKVKPEVYTQYRGGKDSCEKIRHDDYRENCSAVRASGYVEKLDQQNNVAMKECQAMSGAKQEVCLTEVMWHLITTTPTIANCQNTYHGDRRLIRVCEALKQRDREYDRRNIYGAIPQDDRNMLYRFDRATQAFQTVEGFQHPGGWTWSTRIADLDNDGWQDVFNADGAVRKSGYGWNVLMKNLDGKRFEQRQFSAGLQSDFGLYSFVLVDFDNDGDLDIVGNSAEGPVQVFRNNNIDKHRSIAISLDDSQGNRAGIGAKVFIRYEQGKQSQMREIKASGGYLSFDAPMAWFGLGRHDKIEEIRVQWPDKSQTLFSGEFTTGNRFQISR
ncbi:MAG: CRTAC1 family protein [Gammaproteobacteria bacterium]|nr:CRTAC1 family protein [Gammaproteobacteria bacterium]